ncbi:MAG: transcriptional regulator [Nitrospirales bacterium]|nr:MAG: transcriptional regulator [Nitrospirales bacterium]
MIALTVRKIGNSLGVLLPKELLSRLNLDEGEKLFLIDAPDGSYRISAYDPEFEKDMKIAKKGMSKYRNTLRALAK